MHAPPSPTAWRIDGELRGGHSIAETLLWAAWVGDYEDEQNARRALPVGVISVDCEPKWLSKLRGWFGL